MAKLCLKNCLIGFIFNFRLKGEGEQELQTTLKTGLAVTPCCFSVRTADESGCPHLSHTVTCSVSFRLSFTTQSQTLTLKHTRCNIKHRPTRGGSQTAEGATGGVWHLRDSGARPGTCQAQPCQGRGTPPHQPRSPLPCTAPAPRPNRDPLPNTRSWFRVPTQPPVRRTPSATAAHVAGPSRAGPGRAGPLRPSRSSERAGGPRRSRRYPGGTQRCAPRPAPHAPPAAASPGTFN